jgi:hypothetical protein
MFEVVCLLKCQDEDEDEDGLARGRAKVHLFILETYLKKTYHILH